jgi:DNA-binding Lrp family transcriptional regulator
MLDNGIVLDTIDQELLKILQENARISNAELARRVELSPSGLQKRLRRLELYGYIERYAAILNRHKVGYEMMVFVHISLQRHIASGFEAFRKEIVQLPEVLECYNLTGEDDYILKVIVKDVPHLENFLLRQLTAMPAVDKVRTGLVLNEIKSTTAIPVGTDK